MTTKQAPYDGFDRMPIGGQWRAGAAGTELDDTDPWSGELLTRIPLANAADVAVAYAAAEAAQRDWANALPGERAAVMLNAARLLDERHAEIANWVVRESGGTVAKVEIELGVVRAGFLEAAGMPHHAEGRIVPSDIPGKENRVYRRPVGVVCLISPWDFPVYLTNRTLAPALALGNAVVLKPSSNTPVTGGLLLAKLLEEAGLPAGVLNVVVGSSRDIGDDLVAHPAARVVSFTGSTATGIAISRKAGIKKLLLELGGNAPMVILDDADLDYAVESAVFGSFYNSGQICMIANRIIVDSSIADKFTDALVERTRGLPVGDPADPATFIGPVISRAQLDSVQEKVSRAVSQGARLLLGGDPVGPGRARAAAAGAGREQRRRDRAGGGLRAGDHDHRGAGRRRGAAPRQRHGVRPVQRRAHRGPRARHPVRAPPPGRHDARQRLAGQRGGQHRVRRREAIGPWPVRRVLVGRRVHHPPLGVGAARAAPLPDAGARLTGRRRRRGRVRPGTRAAPRRPRLEDR